MLHVPGAPNAIPGLVLQGQLDITLHFMGGMSYRELRPLNDDVQRNISHKFALVMSAKMDRTKSSCEVANEGIKENFTQKYHLISLNPRLECHPSR